MRYSFDDAAAPERHETQYFEMVCNRGIYHQGWSAVTKHSLPWVVGDPPAFDDDVWELYGPDDWTQFQNLAAENPDMLAHLQRLWLIEATKYHVLPLDDRRYERFNSDLAGRPTLIRGTTQLLFGGMGRLGEGSVVNVKNKSHAVTAELVVPEGGASGVIVAQGGMTGGWSLYAKAGTLTYCYNYLGLDRTVIPAETPIPAGAHQVRMEFAYDGGGLGQGGAVTLYVDGQQVGTGRVEATQSMIFSDETCDVGREFGSPVSPDYGPRDNAFGGEVTWVHIDLEGNDHDHLISPEERLQIAMAKQ
jgi:arylsulfatase